MVKDSVFIKRLAIESLTMFKGLYGQHSFDLVFTCLLSFVLCLLSWLEVTKVRKQTYETRKVSVIGVHYVKNPKYSINLFS